MDLVDFLEEDVPDCDCETITPNVNPDTCVRFPIINEANHTLECMPIRRSLPIHTDWCNSGTTMQ